MISKIYKLLVIVIVFISTICSAQIANADCSLIEPWVNNTKFSNLVATSIGGGLCISSANNLIRVTDSNVTNFATLNMTGVGCSRYISVKDNDAADTYPAGTYAGYRIGSGGLIGASLSATIKIDTYSNGAFQETVFQTTDLAGLNSTVVAGDGTAQVGGVTTKDFDEIRITYSPLVSFLYTAEIMYPIIKIYCVGPVLQCATSYRWSNTQFPVELVTERSGLVGGALGSVTDVYNVISPSTADYAAMNVNVGVFGAAQISVRDVLSSYKPGTFAGYDINNASISLEFLNSIQIVTYYKGAQREVSTSGEIFDLADFPGRKTLGFITTQEFDEIKIIVNQPFGIGLGATQVFSPVVAIPVVPIPVLLQNSAVKCSSVTAFINLNSYVTSSTPSSSELRWFDGADPLTANQIATPTHVMATGTYYAFYYNTLTKCYSNAVSLQVLLDSGCDGVADNIDLDDDNDGILDTDEGYCQSETVYTLNIVSTLAGATFRANGGSFNLVYALTSGTAVPSLGSSFNVSFSYSDFNNTATAVNHTWEGFSNNWTSIAIRPTTLSLYTGLPANNTNTEDLSVATSPDLRYRYWINSGTLTLLGTFNTTIGNIPAVSGLLSSYSSNTPLNLRSDWNSTGISPSTGGYYANMQLQNIGNPGNFANTSYYPATYGKNYSWDYTAFNSTGTNTPTNLGNRGLITIQQNTITFCNHRDTDTDGIPDYLDLDSDNDGCLDALEGGANLPTSNLVNAGGTLTVGFGSSASKQNLCASSICVGSTGIPLIVNQTTGQTAGSSKDSSVKAATCNVCYKPTATGITVPSKHGITSLGRAGVDNGNWPMVRNNAWTVLESKTKGFVVNRIPTTAAIVALPNPVEGMMVYDVEADCLKINTDATSGGWKCFNTQTCP